ncbi:MAG: tRNA (adenosine(37)-N6)-threonylcarbamoyltransferase complex ATPase subunit type 1 TsaE [Gemmatimonadota bacterium]|nr:tRNA (adenosine(37)-N6)-threonylcarbamoyltransferase complex ATPase subunit type 1 TsaE [Gemmatimonadota bacterium]MDE2984352.1 tRNA (adenosine(37)-N6)-threonylcarbamoyltransferase complex ATPase subunit type 1 TsaE [Gemmatimonadota bacterium]
MRVREEELVAWGRRVGAGVDVPVFIGLRGPLGAGKSVFARAVARGAGVEGALPSPTFNVVFRYGLPGGGAVIHADLFRLRSEAELAGIGWEDLVDDGGAIVLVEWCERAGDALPRDRWEIGLAFVPGEGGVRAVEIARVGEPVALPRPRVEAG